MGKGTNSLRALSLVSHRPMGALGPLEPNGAVGGMGGVVVVGLSLLLIRNGQLGLTGLYPHSPGLFRVSKLEIGPPSVASLMKEEKPLLVRTGII